MGKFPCGTRVFAVFFGSVTKTPEAPSIRQPEASSAPFLRRLTLRDYRNFERLECEFPEAGVAIIGPNGSGKTNLLEAIYYSRSSGLSRRAGPPARAVRADVCSGGRVRWRGDVRGRGLRPITAHQEGRGCPLEVDRVSAGIGSWGRGAGCASTMLNILRGDRRCAPFSSTLRSRSACRATSGVASATGAFSHSGNEGLRPAGDERGDRPWTEDYRGRRRFLTRKTGDMVSEGAERYADFYGRISGGRQRALRYAASVASGDGHSGVESRIRGGCFREALGGEPENGTARQGVTVWAPHPR